MHAYIHVNIYRSITASTQRRYPTNVGMHFSEMPGQDDKKDAKTCHDKRTAAEAPLDLLQLQGSKGIEVYMHACVYTFVTLVRQHVRMQRCCSVTYALSTYTVNVHVCACAYTYICIYIYLFVLGSFGPERSSVGCPLVHGGRGKQITGLSLSYMTWRVQVCTYICICMCVYIYTFFCIMQSCTWLPRLGTSTTS